MQTLPDTGVSIGDRSRVGQSRVKYFARRLLCLVVREPSNCRDWPTQVISKRRPSGYRFEAIFIGSTNLL